MEVMMSKTMYGISVDDNIVSTVADSTIAATIAAAVSGKVVEVSKAQAGAFVKSATAAPNNPISTAPERLAPLRMSGTEDDMPYTTGVPGLTNWAMVTRARTSAWVITSSPLSVTGAVNPAIGWAWSVSGKPRPAKAWSTDNWLDTNCKGEVDSARAVMMGRSRRACSPPTATASMSSTG